LRNTDELAVSRFDFANQTLELFMIRRQYSLGPLIRMLWPLFVLILGLASRNTACLPP
jgi:hypothetical protein